MMLQRLKLRDRAHGQWPHILRAIGIDPRHLRKRAPCPMCGGTDRFQFFNTNDDGTWFCRGCGKGSGPDLVMRFRGLEFREAAVLIERQLGETVVTAKPAKPAPDPRPKLRRMWAASKPTVRGDVVDTYLRSRGVGLEHYPPCIRTAPSLRYYDDDATSTFPAMLAMVHDVTGKAVTLHRSYLAEDGSGKAPVAATLGIAEGIETALAAARLFDLPVWPVLSTYGVDTFEPPTAVERLIIFGDNDSNGAGQKAAYALAARLTGTITVEVKIPDTAGDWNDVLGCRRR